MSPASAPSTELATLDDYERAGKYLVLHPVVEIRSQGATSEVLVESVSIVNLTPGVDSYNDFRYANERDGKHALLGLGLNKLAAAAGIRWIEPCVVEARERRPDGHVYVRVRSTGAVLQPNGEHYLISAHKEIDTADVAEQLEEGYRRKLKAGRAKFTEDEIPDMVRREILQIREHVLSLAETKAQLRATRKLLGIPQVLTTQQMQQPVVVPRLLVRPDLNDPVMRATAQVEGAQAAATMYGELPAATGEQPTQDVAPEPQESMQAVGKAPEATDAAAGKGERNPKGKGAPPTSDPAAAPTDDPVFPSGDFEGRKVSEIATITPAYLAEVTSGKEKMPVKITRACNAWLRFMQPDLLSGGGE